MKISIITPSYNQARFLERTILGVVNQNYPDLEYIIIDGLSTDGSVEIIKKYERYLTYWVSEKDGGQSNAINKGFKRATGEIIGWINSDDYFEPDVLNYIADAFKSNKKIGTVCGKIFVVGEKDNRIGTRYNKLEITLDKLLNGGADVIQPGAFHRRNLLEKYGYLDESLEYAMDYELWIRLGQYSKIKQIDKFVANYRFHQSSKTQAGFIKFIPEIKSVRKKYGGRFFCKKTLDIFRVKIGYLRRKIIGI